MKFSLRFCLITAALALPALAGRAHALELEWVTVENPGNKPDKTGYGAVAYPYQISRFEVTVAQYAEFLNAAAAKGDPHALWNANMGSALLTDNNQGGIRKDLPVFIDRIGAPGAYRYQVLPGAEKKPVLFAGFLEAMRFANWLHNGQGEGDTENGAYHIAKHGGLAVHEPDARVWIPTEDEWYKAAYHHPEAKGGPPGGYWLYPVRSNEKPRTPAAGDAMANAANFSRSYVDAWPVGSYPNAASFYGTFDQGGNAWEWNEAIVFGTQRGLRGGCMAHTVEKLRSSVRSHAHPAKRYPDTGFRLARPAPKTEPTAEKKP